MRVNFISPHSTHRYFGDGTGGFVRDGGFSAVSTLAYGFLDEDPYLDCVVSRESLLSAFFGRPEGGFGREEVIGGDFFDHSVTADFDGNGNEDAIVLRDGEDRVGVDSFAAGRSPVSKTLRLSGGASSLAAADFDEDGYADVAVTLTDLDQVGIQFGNPLTQPIATLNFATGNRPLRVFAEDLDGDGHSDLVTTHANSITLFFNDGTASFSSPVTLPAGKEPLGLAVGDVNNDGYRDLVLGDFEEWSVRVLFGDKGRRFSPHRRVFGAGGGAELLTSGDFDGDGIGDVVAANRGRRFPVQMVAFYRGRGDGEFEIPEVFGSSNAEVTTGIASADVNGDGHLDVITGDGNRQTVTTLLGLGNGRFRRPMLSPAPFDVDRIGAVDLSGDGRVDLVVSADDRSEVAVLLGTPQGLFSTTQVQVTSDFRHVRGLATGDIDGDGDIDVVAHVVLVGPQLEPRPAVDPVFVPVTALHRFAILRNDSAGTLSSATFQNAGPRVGRFTTADLNGDENAEILVVHPLLDGVTILWNRGAGVFTQPSAYLSGSRSRSVVAVDVDEDEDTDIVVLQGGSTFPDARGTLFNNGK